VISVPLQKVPNIPWYWLGSPQQFLHISTHTHALTHSKSLKQEAFEKCWAHSPLRAAARPIIRCRYRYCHATCASMSTTTTTTTRERGDRYGPMEWAQQGNGQSHPPHPVHLAWRTYLFFARLLLALVIFLDRLLWYHHNFTTPMSPLEETIMPEDWASATGTTHIKFGKVQICGSWDRTQRQTDRHAHHNVLHTRGGKY